jgi:hypothetical protein
MYRMSPHSLSILASAGRLYAWSAPARPEDLAFYTPTGDPWLGSIAHEADSFLFPGVVSAQEVVEAAGLAIAPSADAR